MNLKVYISAMFYAAWLLPLSGGLFAGNDGYAPLAIPDQWNSEIVDLTVNDEIRNRHIPIRVYLPESKNPAAVVLFSHGLGGSCKNNSYLGNHWSGRGYVSVFVQHPGSDETVWKDKPEPQRLDTLKNAASLQNFMLRVGDIPVVLDRLEEWNAEQGHILQGRLDMKRIGMSGHSFGAVTTQAVSGQIMLGGKAAFTDPRIKAAIAFSPGSPRLGSPERAFGSVKTPWMLMTGTKDVAFIGDIEMESRLAVFEALPPGDKYEVVLYNAEHSAFNERTLPGDTEPRNPNHHRAILALSTAFWDAYLKDDTTAKAWLQGNGPRSVLEEKDRWQTK